MNGFPCFIWFPFNMKHLSRIVKNLTIIFFHYIWCSSISSLMKNILIFYRDSARYHDSDDQVELSWAELLCKIFRCRDGKRSQKKKKKKKWVLELKCPRFKRKQFRFVHENVSRCKLFKVQFRGKFYMFLCSFRMSIYQRGLVYWSELSVKVCEFMMLNISRSHHTFNAVESFPAPVDLNVPTLRQQARHSFLHFFIIFFFFFSFSLCPFLYLLMISIIIHHQKWNSAKNHLLHGA